MTVFIAKEDNNVKRAIERILEFFRDRIDLTKGIFLKPNIVFPVNEKSGLITRHCVVVALIEKLREIEPDIDIVIGEGTAAGSIPEENFEISGYRALAKNLGVKLIDLNKTERLKVKWHYGNLSIPKIVLERTYVNLPILKKSMAAGISGALKNQKGILTPAMKKGFHRLGLHKPIACLYKAIQPDISILDGHNFFKENLLIGGDCAAEIDLFTSSLLCPETPEHVAICQDLNLVRDGYRVGGDKIECIDVTKIDTPAKVKRLLGFRLWSNPRACSMCRFLFQDAKRFSKGNIGYVIGMAFKFIKYSVMGADVLYGSKPSIPENSKRIICVGNCNKRIADKMGYRLVPGCPPSKKDMLKYF